MYDLHTLRQQEFPSTRENIYFNNAGIAPLPARSKARVQWAVEKLAQQPTAFYVEVGMPLTENLLADLAQFINAGDPSQIVPITTTSVGLNTFAQSLDWQPGDNLLFCEVEFPSNVYPWMSLERDGVEARPVPAINGGLTLEGIQSRIDDRTRLITVSAVQFFTGHRTDLEAIGCFCREQDILFVVDAIQAIGHMPIDVQAANIDVLATGGQKSLLGLPGLGFMYVRNELCGRLQPRIVAGNSTSDFRHWLNYDLTPQKGAARFNLGSSNLLGLVALEASLGLLQDLGVEQIDAHTRRLASEAGQLLKQLGYEVITPLPQNGPIVTFCTALSDAETDAMVAYLASRQVTVVKHLDVDGVPYVRLSFHCYNSRDELAQFADIMTDFQRGSR